MLNPWVIYVLNDESARPIYVGFSRNFGRRLREHKKVFGYKPSYEILEEGEGDYKEAESRWIEEYRRRGHWLLNKTIGGNGCQTAGPETRALLSRIGRGKPKPDGFGRIVSEAQKGTARNWTPEGEARVKNTQFKPGTNLWAGLSDGQRKELVAKRNATRWSSPEKQRVHAEHIGRITKSRWESMTPEERSAHGLKIAESRRSNHTAEQLSLIARNNAMEGAKSMENRERMSKKAKEWWARMTPDEKAAYVTSRAARIKEARDNKPSEYVS